MKASEFEREYETRASEALKHHIKVVELAWKMPSEEFYKKNHE